MSDPENMLTAALPLANESPLLPRGLPNPTRALRQEYNTWFERPYMTLCIGALAQVPSPLTPCIVLCFDYKIANDEWGSESQYKFHILSGQLVALFAGAPGKAKELSWLYQAHLKNKGLSIANAVQVLGQPLAEFKRQKADFFLKMTTCISYEEFLKNGPTWFGSSGYFQRLATIERHQPKVEMIIAGFIEDQPVLFRLATAGEVNHLDLELAGNSCMIGSGTSAASISLHGRTHDSNTPLSQAMYYVYEAKKAGEISSFVGQKTRMHVLFPPEPGSTQIRGQYLTNEGEKFLQKLHRRYGPKPMKTWPDIPASTLKTAHFRWP